MPGESIDFGLIVGLGNPGSQYENTRHNAGFWLLDEIARRYDVQMKTESRFFSHVGKGMINGKPVYFCRPGKFMNESGQSVVPLARFFKIEPEKMLVIHDELDLPPGQVRIKNGGGHGGHNGLRDIIARLGSKEFWRVRVGVGHPGHKDAVAGYVLKRASSDDQKLIDEALDVTLREIDQLVGGDINVATKAIHSHK